MKSKKEESRKVLTLAKKGQSTKKRTALPKELLTREIDGVFHQGQVMDTTTWTTTTTTTTYENRDPMSHIILYREQIIRKKYTFPINIKFKPIK